MLELANEIKIGPSLVRMAMPETEKEAQRCVEMLEAQKPQKWEDIDGLKREIPNARGELCMNPLWIRAWVKQQKEDKKAAYTAAVMPTDALNKGTESLLSTAKRVLTTRCTARNKSNFCKDYTYGNRLMPCRVMVKDQFTGKERAVGIEEKCVNCYNEHNGTNIKDKVFERMAKEARYKTFNRVGGKQRISRR